MKNLPKLLILIILVTLVSCTKSLLSEADKLYNQEKYYEALKYYDKYLKIAKENPKIEYALYKAGISSAKIFNCSQSKNFFEKLLKKYPNSKYKDEAYFRIIVCPNYFYSKYTKLIYGDSESNGKNAQEKIIYTKKDFKKNIFISQIYSGKKLIAKRTGEIIFDGNLIKERVQGLEKIIFIYNQPLNLNKNNIKFKVEEIKEVETAAGKFYNCIKVITGDEIKIANYYAPEIGRILTSSIYENKEKRIMELISYE